MDAIKNKELISEIVNQKKQLIFKVEQTSDFVYPNEEYKYLIYIKNISGVVIDNIHVIINNSPEIVINEGSSTLEPNIGSLQPNETKLIFLKAYCGATGTFSTHFVCYGNGTGLFNQSLTINCDYNNISDNIIHRIHIYNFSPYEDNFSMTVDDFNDSVTQLFKTQKLPYKAKEQPFPMIKNKEYSINSFINQESESFLQQYKEAKNTKEHEYQYIGRENFNENALEVYEGTNLHNIIEDINNNSQFFRAKFLRTGNNQLLNEFKEISPNGFIYRFGLLSSDIYHYLGVLPTYSYMSDYIFRWAPDDKEPLNLVPKKRAMDWDSKRWNGGWMVYQIATEEYQQTEEWKSKNESYYRRIASFSDKDLAEEFIRKQEDIDAGIRAYTDRNLIKYNYVLIRNYLDTGVFFVNIPFDKIPTNFLVLANEEIEAIIQKAKPYGVKGLIRYEISKMFNIDMEFFFYPHIKPYTEIPMSMCVSPLKIQTKMYDWVTETICGKEKKSWKLTPYNKLCRTWLYYNIIKDNISFDINHFRRRITNSGLITSKDIYTCQSHSPSECINLTNGKTCKYHYGGCVAPESETSIHYATDKDIDHYPDNNIDINMDCEVDVQPTKIDNQVSTLYDGCALLYNGGDDNFSFYMNSELANKIKERTEQSDIFLQKWADKYNISYDLLGLEKYQQKDKDGYRIIGNEKQTKPFNIFLMPINHLDDDISGLGFIDIRQQYHFFEFNTDSYTKKDHLTYKTIFKNNYKTHKECLVDANSLVISFVTINNVKIIIFYFKYDNKLHYFHHTIVSEVKNLFIYQSNTNKNKGDQNLYDLLLCGYQQDTPITINLPQYREYHTYSSPIIANGRNWTNLYRIDRSEDSYTYIQNNDKFNIVPDNILLHFDDINIPNGAIIHDIYLQGVVESNAEQNIYCEYSSQDNNNFEDADSNRYMLKPNQIDIYRNETESFYYLENQNPIDQKAIEKNMIFNESFHIDMQEYIDNDDNYITIQKPFWVELSQFINDVYKANDLNDIVFTIEGYNNGGEVILKSRLASGSEQGEPIEIKIESGYFLHNIPLSFLGSFSTDEFRVRFKFLGLNHKIDIYNTYLTIDFKEKTPLDRPKTFTDECIIFNKNKVYINALDKITPEEINNGYTIHLSFDEISPGTYYRIYYMELVVVYSNRHSSLLVNANKFKYTSNDVFYTTVSGTSTTLLGGQFYNDVSTSAQIESDVNNLNHGIELRDSIYQAFIALTDNITSIEIFPNGFVGNPDSTLKIGLYKNHKHSPGRLIKEVYAPGWIKTNTELKDLYSIKYNLNIKDLDVNEIYWFKIEVLEPRENSYYLLHYSTTQKNDFKLLLKENNDLINTFGSLEFTIYSKNEFKSFYQLPATQNYFNNPYIMIGLHKYGTIKNLKIKKGFLYEF